MSRPCGSCRSFSCLRSFGVAACPSGSPHMLGSNSKLRPSPDERWSPWEQKRTDRGRVIMAMEKSGRVKEGGAPFGDPCQTGSC